MFEYAISQGEGILIEYGVFDSGWEAETHLDFLKDGQMFVCAPCDDDCETGQ